MQSEILLNFKLKIWKDEDDLVSDTGILGKTKSGVEPKTFRLLVNQSINQWTLF